jgi:hypothetical protein
MEKTTPSIEWLKRSSEESESRIKDEEMREGDKEAR